MKFETAFRIFKNKAPVNYPTSQRAADQAYSVIYDFLTKGETTKISIARGHAWIGESRREFDSVMKDIESRLSKLGLL